MATTSLKLPEDLKARAQAAAERCDISTHAFMVNAIELAATNSELHSSFIADAIAAEKHMEETGLGYTPEDVHEYLRAKIRGENPSFPALVSWKK